MRFITIAAASAILALGVAGCGSGESDQPGDSHTVTSSSAVQSPTPESSPPTSTAEASESSTATQAALPEADTPQQAAPAAAAVPTPPPFMSPEEFDPYGPPRFVRCWESNAAVMSDGSIVTDIVNCAPETGESGEAPPRADGCVGPAATCGYYDTNGNPVWVDKETGETSPRYYDEFGNPTMDPN